MKYALTAIQVLLWLFVDVVLFFYYFKWNQFMNKPTWNGFLKTKIGIVRRANNGEKHFNQYSNKYKAAISKSQNA